MSKDTKIADKTKLSVWNDTEYLHTDTFDQDVSKKT